MAALTWSSLRSWLVAHAIVIRANRQAAMKAMGPNRLGVMAVVSLAWLQRQTKR